MTDRDTEAPGDPHSLVAGYLLDALEPDELARFTAHLPACARCRHEIAHLSETVANLGSATRVSPPVELEHRLMASLFGEDTTLAATATLARTRSRRWLWPVAAAATFVLGAGLVAATGVLNPADTDSQIVAEAQLIIDVAGAPDAHFMPFDLTTGAAKIIVSDGMNMGAVMASDLPMPAAGQEYHVWTVMRDGSMVPAASFMPDIHGNASVMLHTGVHDVAGFMLTVDEPGAQHPSRSPLAEVSV